jgi:hypothetical protein
MKKVMLSTLFLIVALISFSQVEVKGYYRKDGTYVQPHYRSYPDDKIENNWSYPGNVNPFTGKVGGTSSSSSSNNNGGGSSYTPSTSTSSTKKTTTSSSTSSFYKDPFLSPKSYKSAKKETVTVSTNVLNVRYMPDTKSQIIHKLNKGTTVTYIRDNGDGWYYVKILTYNSYLKEFISLYGYVSSKYVY